MSESHAKLPSIDLLDQALYEGDPEPTYTWLRENAPVYWDEQNQLWGVSRHEDIVTISRNPKIFCSKEGSRPNTPADPSMINADDPRHRNLRNLFTKDITPRGVGRYEAKIKTIARELVDAVVERGECDLVRDIAIPLPVKVIVTTLGFEVEDWKQFAHWAEVTMAAGGGPRYFKPEVMEAALAFFDRAKAKLEERAQDPQDDWLSRMIQHSESGPAKRSMEEMTSESLLLLNGGSDTTRHVIAGGTLALLQHPDQLARLRDHPDEIPVAVEEMIRWVTPILNMRRTATQDTELAGQAIREGDQLLLMYSSANRDERVFEDPQRFDTTRYPNPHIAFGIGTHFCLGANLARLELRTMFKEILTRLPELELASDAAPEYSAPAFGRGLKSLPVRFRAGG